jgi:hypothetical protein
MKLGIIAGNRFFPSILARNIKDKFKNNIYLVAICFKRETFPCIRKYVDKDYWIEVGDLKGLREIIKKEDLREIILAGQITPARIFKKENWDEELLEIIKETDFRPHSIFKKLIDYLEEKEKVKFLDSTFYLKNCLAEEGVMNGLTLNDKQREEIEFGKKMVSRFVELDIGQTLVVRNRSVVALESMEGTDNTIRRAYRIAGKGCTVLKFSKSNQDLRFDVPIVGLVTLNLLKKTKVSSLVLEKQRVIILEKERFLFLAKRYKIPIVGERRIE